MYNIHKTYIWNIFKYTYRVYIIYIIDIYTHIQTMYIESKYKFRERHDSSMSHNSQDLNYVS